jgi:hypothetical protein
MADGRAFLITMLTVTLAAAMPFSVTIKILLFSNGPWLPPNPPRCRWERGEMVR